MVEKEKDQRIYVEESNIYSEFGGEIEDIDYPVFGNSELKGVSTEEQNSETVD